MSTPTSAKSGRGLYEAELFLPRRVHLSSGQPYRAGPKAGETPPKDALKLRRSGTTPGIIPRGSLGALLGPASAALGPAL